MLRLALRLLATIAFFAVILPAQAQLVIPTREDDIPAADRHAFAACETKARAGDIPAMIELARRFDAGLGTKPYPDEAAEWYKRAADAGNVDARFALGMHYFIRYYDGSGARTHICAAAEAFRAAAEHGHADAMFLTGVAYAEGRGLPQSNTLALQWYTQAIENHSDKAMYTLGVCYSSGSLGLTADPAQALAWFEKGAALKNANCLFSAGVSYATGAGTTKDPAHAVECFAKAADLDHVQAMFRLAGMYARGEGVAADPALAARWNSKAFDWCDRHAKDGSDFAMYLKGLCLLHGVGVSADPKLAFSTLRAAGERKNGAAWLELARCSIEGVGVPVDLAAAFDFIGKSARCGDSSGMTILGMLYENGIATPKHPSNATLWYCNGAAAGHPIAMYHAAFAYLNGVGVVRNEAAALEYIRKSARTGYQPAVEALPSFEKLADQAQRDRIVEIQQRSRIAADQSQQNQAMKAAFVGFAVIGLALLMSSDAMPSFGDGVQSDDDVCPSCGGSGGATYVMDYENPRTNEDGSVTYGRKLRYCGTCGGSGHR